MLSESMLIRKTASPKDRKASIAIARELKEWFNKEGLRNMKIDLELDSLAIAVEGKKAVGFVCYAPYNGKMQLIWMAVSRKSQGRGVGRSLLGWLVGESKKLGLRSIEVETLPDEDEYKPYALTRAFYYRNGFRRIAYKKARVKGYDDQIVMERKI